MNSLLGSIVTILLIILNITGFIMVAADKHKARHKKWRIPEKAFFIMSLMGGCPGVFSGCLFFRHKTKHWSFMLGIPGIFALQLAAVWFAASAMR